MISDTHFGVRNDHPTWLADMESYFDNFFTPFIWKQYDKFGDKIAVTIMGDLFDNRDSVNIQTFNIALRCVKNIASICNLYILVGNHDMYKKKDSTMSSLEMLRYVPNVYVVSTPTTFTFGFGKTVLMIPYTGRYSDESKLLRETQVDFAFLHTDCIGAVFDNGKEVIDGTDATMFRGTMVYSGHIHRRREYRKMTYIGCPYHLRRSDIGNNKGIYELSFETNTHHFYPNNFSPIFQKVKLSDYVLKSLGDFKSLVANNYTDIIVDVESYGKMTLFSLLKHIPREIYKEIEFINTLSGDSDDALSENVEVCDIDMAIERLLDAQQLPDNKRVVLDKMVKFFLDKAREEETNDVSTEN